MQGTSMWRAAAGAFACVLLAGCGKSPSTTPSLGGRGGGGKGGEGKGGDGKGGEEPQSPQTSGRKGSFLVIGDWGWDPDAHGDITSRACQRAVADKMAEVQQQLGDVKFVINVGDSFYPDGLVNQSDSQWQTKWRDVYVPSLRSIPWYSVYGNHDFHQDPCACSDDIQACAQINADINDLDYFYMPALNWFKEHPELGVEVIGMDLNHFMWGWMQDASPDAQHAWDCQWTPCPEKCKELMRVRSEQAFELFYERQRNSSATNLLVFSHYPTDYFSTRPEFVKALSDNSSHHIEYFGGHRHNVDQTSTVSIYPNNNWLSGGGGGWHCEQVEPQAQGFVVGEIADDLTIRTYSVLVDPTICCSPPATSPPAGNESEPATSPPAGNESDP